MPRLRQLRGWDEVSRALAARDASITSRSYALLRGAAALSALLDALSTQGDPSPYGGRTPWRAVASST